MAQISKRGMGVAPQNPAPQLPKFDPVFQGAILQISQSMNHMIRLVRSAGFEEGGFVWTRFGIMSNWMFPKIVVPPNHPF